MSSEGPSSRFDSGGCGQHLRIAFRHHLNSLSATFLLMSHAKCSCLKDFVFMVFWWRFITTVVLWRHDWVCTTSGIIWISILCGLVVFSAALPHTVGLLRRLQYQFIKSWWNLAETRTPDLPGVQTSLAWQMVVYNYTDLILIKA